MNNYFIDIGHCSLIKHGEQLCGDQVSVSRGDDGSLFMVLADGLGSGVKACILATLTAKILSTMLAKAMSIEDCVSTMASTLPVCEERRIAYSTFTIIKVSPLLEAEIIQYDNPRVILLRRGRFMEMPLEVRDIDGKLIYRARLQLREGDIFIAMSDGVPNAGTGEKLNLDWERPQIIEFMEAKYDASMAAKNVATLLLDECDRLYDGRPGDDATVCAIAVHERKPVNLLIGPPEKPEDDATMLNLFFSKQGRRIICGGSTGAMAAAFLGKKIQTEPDSPDPAVPPVSHLQGVDFVTEGAVTLGQVVIYARDYLGVNERYHEWRNKKDGASRLARILFEEATDINFYVGKAVNPANLKPGLPLEFGAKMRLVEDLAAMLRQMGKRVKLSYF